jgi:hypothetical protein
VKVTVKVSVQMRVRAGRVEGEWKVSGGVSREQVVLNRNGRGVHPRELGGRFTLLDTPSKSSMACTGGQ